MYSYKKEKAIYVKGREIKGNEKYENIDNNDDRCALCDIKLQRQT